MSCEPYVPHYKWIVRKLKANWKNVPLWFYCEKLDFSRIWNLFIFVLWNGGIWYWLSGLLLPKIINLYLMQVILKLHVQIFYLTSDTAYLSVYLEQLKKGEGYDMYISIKSHFPDIQRHTPSKTFKFYFWRWFSVTKFGLTFKINHWRMLISRFLSKFWFQNT